MSEKEAINETMEGAMELVEVPTTGNTLSKVVITGVVIAAASVALVMYIRKKRKANAVEAEVVEVKTKNSNKNEK